MKILNISPLSRRIVLPANLIAAVSLAALCALLVYRNDRDSREQLAARAAAMTGFLQQTSTTYLTNFDLSALELFAKQTVRDPDFNFVVFLDEQRKPLTTPVKPESEAGAIVVEESLRDPQGKVLGFVRLGYTTRRIEAVLRHRILLSLGGFCVAQILLTIGLGLVVRSLRRHLSRLIEGLRHAADT